MTKWWEGLKPWQRWSLGIVGSLVIGTVGSGLWQRAGDPAYVWLRDIALDTVTLTTKKYKANIYAEIARGYHEHSATAVHELVTFYLATAMAFVAGMVSVKWRATKANFTKFTAEPPWALIMIILLTSAFQISVNSIRLEYISEAVSYYEQLKRISGPYMTEQATVLVDSTFAQIKSVDDYKVVIGVLEGVLTKNNIAKPYFNIW